MTDQTNQPDQPEGERPRLHIAFTDEESMQVHQVAQWYTSICEAHNMQAPPDPMHALLAASIVLHQRVSFLETILKELDIDPRDHLPPQGPAN